MAMKYQKPFTIPAGFPEVLKSFTREVLRVQPDDLYAFGAAYFGQLAGSAPPAADSTDLQVHQLVNSEPNANKPAAETELQA